MKFYEQITRSPGKGRDFKNLYSQFGTWASVSHVHPNPGGDVVPGSTWVGLVKAKESSWVGMLKKRESSPRGYANQVGVN